MRHRIAAGALVFEGERLLMVHHRVPGRYDFWVPPGGGVMHSEGLAAAAVREVLEETGLEVATEELAYIDELIIGTDTRQCKFWFTARRIRGELDATSNAARAENIVEAAFLSVAEMQHKMVFPPIVLQQLWVDRAQGLNKPKLLGIRNAVIV